MTTHEVLVRARELIADEKRWIKGHAATTATGAVVGPAETGASRFCAVGAVVRCGGGDGVEEVIAALSEAAPIDPTERHFWQWNDAEATHAEVLAAFDKAIAATAPTPDMSWLREPVSA